MKVTDRCYEATGHTCFFCDFSPARSGDIGMVDQANLDADFISVAYNPGRAVRVNSTMLAAAVKSRGTKPHGQDVIFTLATRDMNLLALQSQLLGAQILGLENLVVVQGDPFSQRDLTKTKAVDDVSPTGLIAAVRALNQGLDFRESKLRMPTDFCIGATADLGRGLDAEAELAHRKVTAGADFIMTQPIFDAAEAEGFAQAYLLAAGEPLGVPVFHGLQILERDGVTFSSVPRDVREQLEAGRSGVDIALGLYRSFQADGLHNIYLVPPIRRGGARDYAAAQGFLAQAERL